MEKFGKKQKGKIELQEIWQETKGKKENQKELGRILQGEQLI